MKAKDIITFFLSDIEGIPSVSKEFQELFVTDELTIFDNLIRIIKEEKYIEKALYDFLNYGDFKNIKKKSISTLEKLIQIFGIENTRELVITIFVINNFYNISVKIKSYDLLLHSINVAINCNIISRNHPDKKIKEFYKSGLIYFAGLFHDIGIIILDQFFHKFYLPVFQKFDINDEENNQILIENERLGLNHGEVVTLLLKKWHFNNYIADSLKYHHNPKSIKQKDLKNISSIVYFSHKYLKYKLPFVKDVYEGRDNIIFNKKDESLVHKEILGELESKIQFFKVYLKSFNKN